MDKLGNKDFKGWIKVKESLHNKKSLRSFNEGDIWWCGVGENVGSEICGKGKDFLRPVLIINKLSRNNFIGVPLTSQAHTGSWYVAFEFQDKKEYAVVAQMENISAQRLHHKMGRASWSDLNKVIDGAICLLGSKKNKFQSKNWNGRVFSKVHQVYNSIIRHLNHGVKR